MKTCRGLVALALVFNAARASGQTIQSQLGIAGGVTVPTGAYHSGDLGGFKPGWQSMGLVTFRPDALPISVRVDVTYVHPYVLGGLGTYHATISMTEGTPSQLSSADTSESTVAWNLGAGIAIGGSVTALFIETRYVHVAGGLGYSCPLPTSCPRQNGPPTTFVPIMAGIRFGG